MKHIYSILILISLLFVGTACEDDYRDMVFFTGEAPIYQIGTCDNLIGSVNLYLDKPEGIILGIDGGDGNYSITNGDNSIVSAAFVKSENGYQRLLVTPKSIGEIMITVRDSDGHSASLAVKVMDCMKLVLSKEQEGVVVLGDVTDEQKNDIVKAFSDLPAVKMGGLYELIPDEGKSFFEEGVLRVYLNDSAVPPLVGRYERVPVLVEGIEKSGIQFAYGDEKHIYRVGPSVELTKSMPQDPYLYFWEEVTELCPEEVPEGCSIFFVTLLKLS